MCSRGHSHRRSERGASFTEALILLALAVLFVAATLQGNGFTISQTLYNTSACLGGGSASSMKPPVGGSAPEEEPGVCPGSFELVSAGGPDGGPEHTEGGTKTAAKVLP